MPWFCPAESRTYRGAELVTLAGTPSRKALESRVLGIPDRFVSPHGNTVVMLSADEIILSDVARDVHAFEEIFKRSFADGTTPES